MERFVRLYPDSASALTAGDIAALVPSGAPDDRPFLLVNMIATADGRATIAGRAGPIANRADYELFHALRGRVDAVLVGAETVRVESYGPMEPAAVLVTRSVDVAPDVGLLRAPGNRVIVLTPSPDRELPPTAARVEYLRDDLAAGVRRLRTELGLRSVLCEGGPDPLTILSGALLDPPADLRLLTVHESGGYLFLRYGA
ncbi:MAG TPA: dihydrofolate reductase family protein [Solirubrobacteraceae bacterium]|nr:dihydrofolate reductase family protein [Solirubrobacteraceae bacterium]